MKIIALCHTCAHQHAIEFDPLAGPGAAFADWLNRHPQHEIDFAYPRRNPARDRRAESWQGYLHNADVKVAYGSSAAFTITLASLATSATFVAGRESTAVSNTTNKYLDYLVGGKITVGTTPTANTAIRIYGYGSIDDTPTYIDVLDGTDSAETFPNVQVLESLPLIAVLSVVATTSDIPYWASPTSMALRFGGQMPKNFGLFVSHNTGVNLHATGGNHVLSYTGVYATVV